MRTLIKVYLKCTQTWYQYLSLFCMPKQATIWNLWNCIIMLQTFWPGNFFFHSFNVKLESDSSAVTYSCDYKIIKKQWRQLRDQLFINCHYDLTIVVTTWHLIQIPTTVFDYCILDGSLKTCDGIKKLSLDEKTLAKCLFSIINTTLPQDNLS